MYLKTKGLILKQQKSEGINTYLTAYTLDLGKTTYLVRGLNKNTAKLKAALLPFSYSEIIAVPSKGSFVVTRATLIKNLYPKNHVASQCLAFYLIDLADKLTQENLQDKRILLLLLVTLSILQGSRDDRKLSLLISIYAPLKLVKYLGYLPELNYCTACSKKIVSGIAFLSYQKNGLLCPECIPSNRKILKVSFQEIKFLRGIFQKNFDFIKKTILSLENLKKLSDFANLYTFYVTELRPQSYAFVRSLKCLSF